MALYVSDLLTATAAPVSAAPTSTRTWQWLRGSSAISGATSATYTAVTADIGSPLSASQIEANVAGTATATSAPTETVQAFDPIRLFSASEPGVWFDPSDISTLFKGPTPQAPVTAPGDTVYLMLDKSGGLVLGPELITNAADRNFSSDTGFWTKEANVTISGGSANWNSATVDFGLVRDGFVSNGKFYEITFTVSSISSGGIRVWAGAFAPLTATTVGTFTTRVFCTGNALGRFVFSASSTGTTASIDNISVKELPGNHATQATTASQPTYGIVPAGGRRNIMSWSEDLRNTAAAGSSRPWLWQDVTVVANDVLAPDGTLTADKVVEGTTSTYHVAYQSIAPIAATSITFTVYAKAAERSWLVLSAYVGDDAICYFDLSGAGAVGTLAAGCTGSITAVGSSGWFRCAVTRTKTAGTYSVGPAAGPTTGNSSGPYTGNGTSGIYLWGWQAEINATATPYQRVTTQYDVTEAGVASLGYLFFDGSGDFMSTGTITPGTDKAQVFTGVRKLAGTAGMIVESSIIAPSNAGAFFLGSAIYAANDYAVLGSGAGGSFYVRNYTGFTAPIANVLSAIMDNAGATIADEVSLRANGVVATVGGTSTGASSGNFGAYPLYIGRRGGTDLPFSGHIHSLIVRFGPNLTTARISATESWVASKTAGAPAL